MRVVATTGMPGSGKGLAEEVARELDIEVVSMGDLVRAETERQGLPDAPESYGKVASEIREAEGADAWARRTVEHLQAQTVPEILIDGVRNLEEVEVFREAFGDSFTLVAILASPDTRYDRMQARGRGEDSTDVDVLRQRDLRELGYGLGDAIAMADIYVTNEGDPADTRSLLRGILGAGA